MIVLQGAIEQLEFESDKEREEYLDDLARTFPERLRQSVLTWRANRTSGQDLATAQQMDRERRGT